MIPILYPKTETAFTGNGIGKLAEATRCEVTEERNGEYELVLEYPVDGKHAADITEGAYILAKHDDGTDLQPFQIYKISTPLEGKITVNAWHISYALTSIILKPYTAGSLAAALSGITTNSMNTNPFTFWTDKTMTADFTLDVPASVRSVLGGMAGSILDIYGPGEYEFDKYTVKFYANRGSNKGVSIRYRKNLTSLDQEINASEKFNAVMPYWTGSDSKVVSDALVVRTGETADRAIALDLSGEFDEAPTVAQLKARAQTIIDGSANYRVRENIKVDFVPLWQTEEYKTVAALQRVMLCDTVNIFYEKLGINATAKCIKVVYDTLRERYNSIELGEPRTTLGDQIRGEITQEITEKVPTKGFIETAIEKATELIAGGFGGYIKFVYLSDGTPSEMLIMDSPDEATAVNIIRLNQNGLGFSTDGGATYANAWTIDGNLNASFITTGILNAARIQAGLLQDASGKNYWNLDTGQFVTQQGQIADFIIDQTSLRSGTVGKGTAGTAITDGTWESTKTGTISGSGYTYQYTVKTKISNGGIELYAARDDVDADLVQVLKIEPHVWYVNGTARHNVYFSTSGADGYLFSISKSTEVGATAYPLNVHKRTEFLEAVKFDDEVVIGTQLTPADLAVAGDASVTGDASVAGTFNATGKSSLGSGYSSVANLTAFNNAILAEYANMSNGQVSHLRVAPSASISPFGAYVQFCTIYKINSGYGAVEAVCYHNDNGFVKYTASIWNNTVTTWTAESVATPTVATNANLKITGNTAVLDFDGYSVPSQVFFTLASAYRPIVTAHGTGRYYDGSKYYPALITVLTNGQVSASYYIPNSGTVNGITGGTLVGSVSYIIG